MIISKTPFRISFLGGGTDLPAHYRRAGGAVLSTTIDKYMYVAVNPRFEDTLRVAYTRTEIVESLDELQHELVREALRLVGVKKGVEVVTIADVPAGTGLGSSSSLTVGLLHALYAYTGKFVSRERLAREACEIEIERLGHPIGKQDQYAAAYGGLNFIRFNPDETVFVEPVICSPEVKKELFDSLLIFYTGLRRSSGSILWEQARRAEEKHGVLVRLSELAEAGREAVGRGDLESFGLLLHEGWQLKRTLASGISRPEIDAWYETARAAGALGGKILGAGGGGFLLLFCPVERKEAVRLRLSQFGLREFQVAYEPQGSRIIYQDW
ncbi:MAG TPA: GHMP kinase [Candidatus Acetothermia bacterium]|nr:GHMP kinase [Candidatus Acetothermia bacterium]